MSLYLISTKNDFTPNELIRFNRLYKHKINCGLFNEFEKIMVDYYRIKFHFSYANRIMYARKLFRLYNQIYVTSNNYSAFLNEGILYDFVFNDAVNMALIFKKHTWTKNFILKFKKYLDPLYENDAYNLSMSRLNFSLKKYDETLEFLNKMKCEKISYYYLSKFAKAKVFYETGELNSIKYLINNLTDYLRDNKKLLPEDIMDIRLFNKFLILLLKIRNTKNPSNLQLNLLKRELDASNTFVPNQTWFYEKINELYPIPKGLK